MRDLLIVAGNNSRGVATSDGRRVGVNRVNQELHINGLVPRALLSEVIWQNQTGVQFAAADRLTKIVAGCIVAFRLEDPTFIESRDQIATLRAAAVIDDAQSQIFERWILSDSEKNDVECRRNN